MNCFGNFTQQKELYEGLIQTFFPNLDKDPEWELFEESEEQAYFDTTYTFRTYKRV